MHAYLIERESSWVRTWVTPGWGQWCHSPGRQSLVLDPLPESILGRPWTPGRLKALGRHPHPSSMSVSSSRWSMKTHHLWHPNPQTFTSGLHPCRGKGAALTAEVSQAYHLGDEEDGHFPFSICVCWVDSGPGNFFFFFFWPSHLKNNPSWSTWCKYSWFMALLTFDLLPGAPREPFLCLFKQSDLGVAVPRRVPWFFRPMAWLRAWPLPSGLTP